MEKKQRCSKQGAINSKRGERRRKAALELFLLLLTSICLHKGKRRNEREGTAQSPVPGTTGQ